MPNFVTPNTNAGAYMGISEVNPRDNYIRRRPPTVRDFRAYNIGDRWVDKSAQQAYILVSKTNGNAIWIPMGGGGGGLNTINLVAPIAGNINFTDGGAINIVNGVGTISLAVKVDGVTISIVGDQLVANSSAILSNLKFAVNASTPPGTNPVVPDGTGTISLFGAAIPALGIPIRTDSLAANTYTIEVQVASAQAVSAIANAGVCSFNNTQFAVDVNGFVSSTTGTTAWLDSAGGALVNHVGYFATAAAVFTLPAGVVNGDEIEIVDTIGGGVVVTAQGGNFIQDSNTASSANGTATSTQKGDSMRLIFRLADLTWYNVPSASGTWLLA